MTIMRKTAVPAIGALLIALLLMGLLNLSPTPVAAQNTACYRPVGGASFECGDGGTFLVKDGANLTVESGGTLTVDSGATMSLAGYVTSTVDSLTVSTFGKFTKQTGVVVAQGSIITPTGTYQPISAAGAVSTGSIATGTAGEILILTNTAANTITISDTGTLKLAGDAAIGQYDTLTLLSDGTNWLQVSKADN